MTRTVRKHKTWLVPIFVFAAMVLSLYGWQQIHAQPAPMTPPGTVGAPGTPAAPAAAAPSGPTIAVSAVMPAGVKAMNVKNWDGTVTSILRFKYKTMDDKVITVHLPSSYKNEKMTREAWDTLFQCFGMDVEAQMEAKTRGKFQGLNQLINEAVQKAVENMPEPDQEGGGESPAVAAFNYAKMHGTGGDNSVMMPPMLPGMF